jgi:hypothetical protein
VKFANFWILIERLTLLTLALTLTAPAGTITCFRV